METWKKHWGANQWAAFFETKKLPVMGRSKLLVAALEEQQGEQLAPHDLAQVVLGDPLLCLQLLREAERIRTNRLGNETTTTLQAVMQLGVDNVKKLLFASTEIDDGNAGLLYVEARSALAARVALRWASGRADLNPVEVSLAALLSDTGELLLWLYCPELAQAALDELRSGRAKRSAQAQTQACGFSFKELTIRCAEIWNLPTLLRKLLHGAESERALLTRSCTDFARHLLGRDATADEAMANDLVAARKLVPGVSFAWLLEEVAELDAEHKQGLCDRAEAMHNYDI